MKGTTLPEDWQPSDSDFEYGFRLGLLGRQIIDMAEDMRLWAGANGNRQVARKANWSMAFKGWMRREAQKMPKQNGRQTNGYATPASLLEIPGYVHVMRESADWPVYAEHWRTEKGHEPPIDKSGGWWFPQEMST